MTSKNDTAEVKALLQTQILALVMELAPDGYRAGRYWLARNPSRDDRKPGSFYVWVMGPATGGWRDEATGEKGDVFGLIGICKGLPEFKDQIGWAKHFLRLDTLSEETKARIVAARDSERKAEERNYAKDLEKNRGRAFALWLKGNENLAGTKAETYLASRGIDLTKLERPPRALRFLQGHKHLESRELFDCIVARMDGPDGKGGDTIYAVHRTWLARDGRDKAPVTPQRKIWPAFAGGAIRLSRGMSGLAIREATKQGIADTLVLTEGVEDGLSVAIACPDFRVWAAGSLGNLAHIALPACCTDVIVCADNDWGKPQAAAQLEKAVLALSRKANVRVARAPIGKDVNDTLLSGASVAHAQPRLGAA